jgi:hypothetical protein
MTPEEITALFADAAAQFTPIVGNPSDDDLTAMRELITPLLLNIPYNEDGNDNLVGLIAGAIPYEVTWGQPFTGPDRPTSYDPAIPADAPAVIRNRMEATHKDRIRDFASFEAAKRAVTKFIHNSVDEIWYKDLKNPQTFYTSVTAMELFMHLDDNCGGLHPSELISLPTKMMGYYAIAEGIPEYINMLEEAQCKLGQAQLPMSDRQLLVIASTAVLAAQHFPRTTDEWEALVPGLKTWPTWKLKYQAAHIAPKQQLLASGMAKPLGRAHAVTSVSDTLSAETFDKLDGYLDNLANAATHEKTTLASLVEANATLTANNAMLTTSFAALSAAYVILAAKAKCNNPTDAGAGTRNNCRRDRTTGTPQVFAADGYC